MAMRNTHMLPLIDDPFNQLKNVKIFSKIDFRSRYYQLRIKGEHILVGAFKTQYGHYEFLVMTFRLTNTLTTCMDLMD